MVEPVDCPESESSCGFHEAWIGRCEELRPCEKHHGRVCGTPGCAEPATYNCDETLGAFICGANKCSGHGCEHESYQVMQSILNTQSAEHWTANDE